MSENRSTAWIAGAAIAVGVALGVGYLVGHRAAEPAAPLTAEAAPVAAAPAAPSAAPAAAPAPVSTVAEAPAARASAPPPATRVGERYHPPVATPEAATEETRTEEAPAAEPASAEPAPAEPASQVESVEIAAGTRLALRAVDPVSSQTAQVGDAIVFELVEPVMVDGRTALPAGARVTGQVTQVVPLKRVGGQASLALAFDTVLASSGRVGIDAAWARLAKSETGKDAATIAAGALLGAIAGNQSRHNDRGKLIGAVVGAAAGTAIAASTPGESIELPAGAALEATLRQPVTVTIRD